jgi:hypothetical protein
VNNIGLDRILFKLIPSTKNRYNIEPSGLTFISPYDKQQIKSKILNKLSAIKRHLLPISVSIKSLDTSERDDDRFYFRWTLVVKNDTVSDIEEYVATIYLE